MVTFFHKIQVRNVRNVYSHFYHHGHFSIYLFIYLFIYLLIYLSLYTCISYVFGWMRRSSLTLQIS